MKYTQIAGYLTKLLPNSHQKAGMNRKQQSLAFLPKSVIAVDSHSGTPSNTRIRATLKTVDTSLCNRLAHHQSESEWSRLWGQQPSCTRQLHRAALLTLSKAWLAPLHNLLRP